MPALADASGAGDHVDRDVALLTAVVDVGRDAVGEWAVARSEQLDAAGTFGERLHRSAPRLEPLSHAPGLAAPEARLQPRSSEAAFVVASQLPGQERRQAARPGQGDGEGDQQAARERPSPPGGGGSLWARCEPGFRLGLWLLHESWRPRSALRERRPCSDRPTRILHARRRAGVVARTPPEGGTLRAARPALRPRRTP